MSLPPPPAEPSPRGASDPESDLIDELGVVVFRVDAATLRLVAINRRAEELLGVPRATLLADPDAAAARHVPQPDRAALRAAARAVAEDGAPRTVEHRLVGTALGERFFRTEVRSLGTRSGRAPELFGLMLDVTEERRAEARARESEARLAALVESLPFDVFALDVDGRYTLLNAAAREKNLGPYVGMRMQDAPVSAELLERWADNNRRAMAGEVVRGEVVYPIEGVPRTFYNVVAPIRDQGEVRGILGVNIELTELRRTEQERDQLIAELRRSLEQLRETQAALVHKERLAALGEMAAAVAHEVRNPLGAIFNVLYALRRLLPPTDESALLLGILEEEAERLNRIVTDLLDFARPAGVVAQPEPLARLVDDALAAALRAAPTASVTVVREFDPALPDVPLDRRLMHLALVNLVSNALQAMPGGGELTVALRREGTCVRLVVGDTGIGIAQEVLPRIFGPFFTTRASGTGLGLSLVKRIVEEHHGTIEVASEPGRGTRFVVRLPAA